MLTAALSGRSGIQGFEPGARGRLTGKGPVRPSGPATLNPACEPRPRGG